MSAERSAPRREKALLVNRFAMPFAVLTVSLGIILGAPSGWTGRISFALLVFGAVFNVASGRYLSSARAASKGFIHLRMGINLGCNAIIVWLLGGYWTPSWLLLALTPLAAAIYSTRGETLITSGAVSAFLLFRHAMLGVGSPIEWGEQVCYAAFIILASLMVQQLGSKDSA